MCLPNKRKERKKSLEVCETIAYELIILNTAEDKKLSLLMVGDVFNISYLNIYYPLQKGYMCFELHVVCIL